MPNDRLRDALARHQLSPAQAAARLGVDPKTVERWVTTGRAPYPRHRRALAAQLDESESFLWPDAISRDQAARITSSEVVRIYPRRSAVPGEVWRRLLADATERVQVLAYGGGIFLAEQNHRYVSTLRIKAEAGVDVTVLLGDPDSAPVAVRATEEGIGEAMADRIRSALDLFTPLRGLTRASVRLHRTTLYNSIFRYDDEMLVNTHVLGFPAHLAPVLHLRRLSGGELFSTYAHSLDRVRAASRPAWND